MLMTPTLTTKKLNIAVAKLFHLATIIKLLKLPTSMETANTRKPCYRKDDRAMRSIYGCPIGYYIAQLLYIIMTVLPIMSKHDYTQQHQNATMQCHMRKSYN